MSKLVCTVRDLSTKSKKLRREGFVPGNLVGKNLEGSISLTIDAKALSDALKDSAVSSQIQLDIDGTDYNAMIKTIDFVPMSTTYEHIEFQALTSGEKIKTSVAIHYINADAVKAEGNIQELVHTLDYEVLPKDMIESIDVDISTLTIGNAITVGDLDIAKDNRYNILTADNVALVSLTAIQELVVETNDTAQVAEEE